jgi:hypothetical protein
MQVQVQVQVQVQAEESVAHRICGIFRVTGLFDFFSSACLSKAVLEG